AGHDSGMAQRARLRRAVPAGRDRGERSEQGQHERCRAGRSGGPRPVPGHRPHPLGRQPGRRGRRRLVAAAAGPARLHRAGRRPDRGPGRRPGSPEGSAVTPRAKSSSRLAIRYFDDRVLLTDAHAWAYFRLPSVSYEFTTPEEREALATNITVALAAIRMPDAEVHLRVAHRSYPAAEWATGLDATADGGAGWREYLDESYQHVWSKEIYLGVRLGQRGMRAQLSGGVLSQFISIYQSGERKLGIEDEAVGGG